MPHSFVTAPAEFDKYADLRSRYFGPPSPESKTVPTPQFSNPDFLLQVEAFAAIKSAHGIETLYQVHKSMNVEAGVNTPDNLIANLEEARPADKCPANIIKMSIAPDGKSYTISIPANGHSKTYKTKG